MTGAPQPEARRSPRPRAAVRRLRRAALPVVQAAVAAGLSWLAATELLGHAAPFFAPIAAVVSLGASYDRRRRRAAELMAGVVVGIAVADLLVLVIGSGAWQIALVVALAMATAVLLDGGPVFVVQSAASAVLVVGLDPGGGFPRAFDALVGAVVGLVVAALLPGDPLRVGRRELHALFDELDAVLDASAAALRTRDESALLDAISRARGTQPAVDAARDAVRQGREITTLAPLRRRDRAELDRLDVAAVRTDYALRNSRVLARRALAALRAGEPLPGELADRIDDIALAVRLLRGELDRGVDPSQARAALVAAARGAGATLAAGTGFSGRVVVAQVRSVLVDLLQATGTPRADAVAALPALPGS